MIRLLQAFTHSVDYVQLYARWTERENTVAVAFKHWGHEVYSPVKLIIDQLKHINAAQQMQSTHMNNFNSNSELHYKIMVLYNLIAVNEDFLI